jgi:4-aminobutyrate aminotransferase-like enzyme
MLVFDEVQTGVGRTGEFYAWQGHGVRPDAVTLAKGLANGLPIGALLVSDAAPTGFVPGDHASTFGGNPVSCAAANATLSIIEEEDLPGNAARMGALLRAGLEELQKRHSRSIGQVRGMGLMQALELVEDETAGNRTPAKALTARVFEETKKRGLLIGKGGLDGNCFRIAPALNVTRGDVEEALTLLGESFVAAGAK